MVHVITDLHTGGAEGMLTSLVLRGAAGQRPLAVVSLLDGGYFAEILDRAGVTVFGLGVNRGWRNPVRSLGAPFRLARLIRRLQPDVIQSWMYHADLLALFAWFLSGRRRRTRLYWGVRCSDMDVREYGVILRTILPVCALLSRLPTAVVANSVAGREAHKRLGYRPKRFPVIDNGIDLARFVPSPGTRENSASISARQNRPY